MRTKQRRASIVDELIAVIRREIASQNITVRELAEKAGMGYPYLYRILKGEHSPTVKSIEKIAEALGLEVSLKIT